MQVSSRCSQPAPICGGIVGHVVAVRTVLFLLDMLWPIGSHHQNSVGWRKDTRAEIRPEELLHKPYIKHYTATLIWADVVTRCHIKASIKEHFLLNISKQFKKKDVYMLNVTLEQNASL